VGSHVHPRLAHHFSDENEVDVEATFAAAYADGAKVTLGRKLKR
jgi:hypothetical protein